jgi:uncharacterized circularly permuted ATP-grasp superfamily protein/uncharacterized alpha-E superfamily protein
MSRTDSDATLSSWTQGYFGTTPLLDEAFEQNGTLREHWKKLMSNVEDLDTEELKGRQQELLNLLKENGVTYNIYGDPNGLNRPWQLDTIPLVLRTSDWKVVEKGMKQRAYVLDKLLQDLYGERKLLKEGIIPPDLIYSHSGFLRPCDGVKLPGPHQLILYAADLSRGPDGKVWLLRDRTQAPSGMGYALENRSALGRILPELFKGHQVNKLGGFFNSIMEAFVNIAPQGKDQPRVVLLTPGPANETYFEHAFLSSYLGFTLVQGEDLLVRDGYVWIKTVEGLEKVDIILRRVDDSFCDPLELREDSHLGVPGLLEVIRRGNVAVANPLGSSILENTGLMAFMHSIFRYFLNEDPVFPMVATWWCGQKKELSHVLAHFNDMVVKKIDRATGTDTFITSQMASADKNDLMNRIKAEPYKYVGQEPVNLSTSPVMMKGRLEPRYTVTRTFLVASDDGYTIMPGGLSRCAPEKGSLIVTNQEGGISKDTWIETRQTEEAPHLLHRYDLHRRAVLPSRAAENLFWVGRYAQRIVRISRFMRMVLRNMTQSSSSGESEAIRALLKTVTHLTASYPGFLEEEETPLQRKFDSLHQLFCDSSVPGSIVSNVNSLLRATYAVRDKWTVDNWKIIDDIETIKRKLAAVEPKEVRLVFSLVDQLNRGLLSFVEMNRQSLYRGEGWMMYRIGQIMEEVQVELTQYRSLLTFEFEESVEFQILEALLTSNQNLSNYRSVYRTYFDTAPAIDLLFFNRKNPISVLMQLEQLVDYVEQLPQSESNKEVSNLAFECYSMVRLASLDALLKTDEGTQFRSGLDEFCGELTDKVGKLSAKLSAQYFRHSTYQQQGVGTGFEFEV